MIQISKEEKRELAAKFPDLRFVRTMKQDSKRGHYYCPEERRVMKYLFAMRKRRGVKI